MHQGLVPAAVMPGLFWLSGPDPFLDGINSSLAEIQKRVTGRHLFGLIAASARAERVVLREFTPELKRRMGESHDTKFAMVVGQAVVDAGLYNFAIYRDVVPRCDRLQPLEGGVCHGIKAYADRVEGPASEFPDRERYAQARLDVPVAPNLLIKPADWDWVAPVVVHELVHCLQFLDGRRDYRKPDHEYAARWKNFGEGEAMVWENAFRREVDPAATITDYHGTPL